MNDEQIKKLLLLCYHEFCDFIGDSPCGCDACPYQRYNTEDEYGCSDAYINDKLTDFKKL